MIHLARRLTTAGLRTAPGRSLAVAALLVTSALLSAAIGTQLGYGVVLAAAVSFCATVGVLALEGDRTELLEQNGARPAALAVVGAGSMLPPSLLATAVALGLGLVVPDGPPVLVVLLATLVVPLVTAVVAVWVAGVSAEVGARRRKGWTGRTLRLVVWSVLVLLVLVMPVLGVALVALRLTAGAWSTSRGRRAAGGVLALLCVAAAAVAFGSSTTWWDLGIALLLVGPGLVVASIVLGMHAVAFGAGLAGRVGPRARLSLVPLTGRRRALAPLVGVIAFVSGLAVSEAVVGASFGEREANRERDIPTLRAEAGSSADQAIVVVPPVDAAELRALADERVAGSGATAVVVEQLGFDLPRVPGGPFGLLDLTALGARVFVVPQGIPGSDELADLVTDASETWIGVVAPEDLAAMGWSSAAPALEAGQVVLTSGAVPTSGGTVTVASYGNTQDRPAVAVDGPTGGYLLPAAVVSSATGDDIAPARTTARVVVVPTPGAADPPSQAELVELANSVASGAASLPLVQPPGLPSEDQPFFQLEQQRSRGTQVFAGDELLVVRESGPLNDLPSFARTADEGRGRLVGQGALALLMTVAGVLLALGATRADDVVLDVQGAPAGLRASVSAIQAAVIAGSAAVFAAVAGIGVPAAAFAQYNSREVELPDIPLVVPSTVWWVLLALPVLAAAISAVIPALRRPASPDALAALGG